MLALEEMIGFELIEDAHIFQSINENELYRMEWKLERMISEIATSPLAYSIEYLEMSVRAYNICKRAGINTLGELYRSNPLFLFNPSPTGRGKKLRIHPGEKVISELEGYRRDIERMVNG